MIEIVKKQPHAIKLSIWRVTHLICAVSISFMLMPFLINRLGNHTYGIWILVSAFSAYYGMVDLGLSTATQRYIAQAIGRNEPKSIDKILSTAIVSYSVLAIIVLLLGGIGYFIIPYLFKWESNDLKLLQNCFVIMLGGLTISFPLRSFTGMLGAALRQDISAKVDIFYVSAKAAGTVFVILMGKGIVYIAIVSVIVDIVYYVAITFIVRNVYLSLSVSLKNCSFSMSKKLFKYAFYSFINKVSEILKLRIDSVVISLFLVVSDVTIYSVAFRLFEYFNEIIVSAVGFSDSYFSRYDGAKQHAKMETVFMNFTKITTILSMFIGLSLLFYGKYFIFCWVGNSFSNSFTVLLFLVPPGILMAIQDPLRKIFFAKAKHHILSYVSMLEAIVNVVLSVFLIQFYGIFGVALGTAIPSLVTSLLIIPYYGCKIINCKLRDYWLKSVIWPAFITSFYVVTCFLLIKENIHQNFGSIIFYGLIQTLLFIPFCYFTFLNKLERLAAISFVRIKLLNSRKILKDYLR